MERFLHGLAEVVDHLRSAGHLVQPRAQGLMLSTMVGGRNVFVDGIWDRVPGCFELLVAVAQVKIARERRPAAALALQAINSGLAAPGFYLGQEGPVFRVVARRNHDDSISAHVVDRLLAAALWALDHAATQLEEVARG